MTNNRHEEMALMDARDVSRRLSVSTRTVWRLLSAGQLPKPVRIGRSVRWRREIIEEWILEGCPVLNTHHQAPESIS